MSILPPSPFSNPVESFPASTRSAAAVAPAPTPAAAEPIPNSASNVMLPADAAAPVMDPATVGVAVPISVCRHNAITQAVEIRPDNYPRAAAEPLTESTVHGGRRDRPNRELDSPDGGQNHIGEIFVGARRLSPRVLPLDFQALLDAITADEIYADPPPLFLRQRSDNA